jgi:PKD repeat protein
MLFLMGSLVAQDSCESKFIFAETGHAGLIRFNGSSSTGSDLQYLWDFGDNEYSQSENPLHYYASPGDYEVCLQVYNPDQTCIDSICRTVSISQPDSCSAFFLVIGRSNDGTIQYLFQFLLDDTNTNYTWDYGDGEFGFEKSPNHLYVKSGDYEVCVTVINTASDCEVTFCDTVRVDKDKDEDPCTIDFSYTIVDSTVYFFDESTSSFDSYRWTFGDGPKSTAETRNSKHTYNKSGDYYVTFYGMDSSCTASTVKKIHYYTPEDCQANFTTALNKNEEDNVVSEVLFNNQSTGKNLKFSWDFGDETESAEEFSPKHVYEEAGDYKTCLLIKDTLSGCLSFICRDVQIQKLNQDPIKVLIEKDKSFDKLYPTNAYPNPSEDVVNIEVVGYEGLVDNFSLFDYTGRRVKNFRNFGSNDIEISKGTLSTGMYTFIFATENKIIAAGKINFQ